MSLKRMITTVLRYLRTIVAISGMTTPRHESGDRQIIGRISTTLMIDLLPHGLRRTASISLFDLNGYSKGERTKVVALRPAPIAVNWFAFPGTMGPPYHHYLIADDYIIPPDLEISLLGGSCSASLLSAKRSQAGGLAPLPYAAGCRPSGRRLCLLLSERDAEADVADLRALDGNPASGPQQCHLAPKNRRENQ